VKRPNDALIDLHDPASWRPRRPLLVAHRGGVVGPGSPENSAAAIRGAADAGYDMVELDTRASRDGEPVLFHGDYSRTMRVACGVDRALADMTIAELRVLRFLPSHLSFREIAARLGVSPNTVKTQAHAVYRKLDASSRSEAVVQARGMGLIDDTGPA
jgi:glycerophosphoryl diester phosphodiesterase